MKFTNDDLKKNIRDTLGLKENLSESYVAQPKQFDLKTELLSQANKRNHIELYDQYIKDFNRISAELDTADRASVSSNSSDYRSLKIDETYNMNAAYLHELYFSNISDLHSEIPMDSLSYMRLARDFGSFDAWQKDFIACCMASRCGWAMTYFNTYLQSYMNCSIDLHSKNVPVGSFPIIVMDVWQHAYYRDYLKDAKTYTYGMMKQLNWKVIESRFRKAEEIHKALRS
jgi:Fe-Mn family superoxide dismutase|tara:strand:+ start:6190 stop:6876 length:687 start_codon:yes stop_codon:yes gene_type:complete